MTVEVRWADQRFKFRFFERAGTDDGNGLNRRVCQQAPALIQIEKRLSVLVVDIELKKVMCQLPVMNRVPSIDPLPEQDEPILKPLLQHMPLHRRPLLEEIVL